MFLQLLQNRRIENTFKRSKRIFKQVNRPNKNNAPDPTDLSLRESSEIEQIMGTKLRMAQYIGDLIDLF